MSQATCPAGCDATPAPTFDLTNFTVDRCPTCGVYSLQGQAGQPATALDREQFADAFRSIRWRNYGQILDQVGTRVSLAGALVLDVGCSVGWFLEAAAARGCRCLGIEPDAFFCERAREALPASIELAQGYFPADLPPGWAPFDVITFHDVFEHLPDPRAMLRACRERLTSGGVTVLSLPSADGFVYQIGRLLYRLGWKGPLERMYQVHYPFPHLFYFTPKSLALLAQRAGFEVVHIGRLDGFAVSGALARARMDEGGGVMQAVATYLNAAVLVAFALLQRALPSDNIYVILRSRNA
jgi:SAM-dependent methyltransferase